MRVVPARTKPLIKEGEKNRHNNITSSAPEAAK